MHLCIHGHAMLTNPQLSCDYNCRPMTRHGYTARIIIWESAATGTWDYTYCSEYKEHDVQVSYREKTNADLSLKMLPTRTPLQSQTESGEFRLSGVWTALHDKYTGIQQ